MNIIHKVIGEIAFMTYRDLLEIKSIGENNGRASGDS